MLLDWLKFSSLTIQKLNYIFYNENKNSKITKYKYFLNGQSTYLSNGVSNKFTQILVVTFFFYFPLKLGFISKMQKLFEKLLLAQQVMYEFLNP